jgi:signal transduction histidine kinase
LEWLATDAAKYSGISTNVKVVGTERRFPEEVELVLFRITQEALRNVWRHSQATKAEITVQFDETRTRITVADNGKGFKLSKSMNELARDGKLGLAGMQERAQLLNGTVTVESEPGKGTKVVVDVLA